MKKRRLSARQRQLYTILAASALYIAGLVFAPAAGPVRLGVFLAAYLLVGWDVLYSALRGLVNGQMLDENLLMAIASAGAFLIGDYPEGAAVMLFFQVGELFQSYAVDKSRRSIAELMDIRPDTANLLRDGELVAVDPDEVPVGAHILVRPGERVPLDGVVLKGHSMLDTSALTGESVPRELLPGAELLSGCINLSGVLTAEVTREYGESTVSKILDLVENASSKKSNSEKFITKFARYYTPAVCGLAAALAVLPPLFLPDATFRDWGYRALVFLVISCPCALVISVPLSFFGGIGGASKNGILVKGSNYLEALAQTETAVFDKTGTLTKGVFRVQSIHPAPGVDAGELLELAAHVEDYSKHPISLSLREAYGRAIDAARISEVSELPGRGVQARIDGRFVAAGNAKLMGELALKGFAEAEDAAGTVVYLAREGQCLGYIDIADEPKDDAKAAIASLKAAGVRTVMLTGDTRRIGERVAKALGLDEVHTDLLPGDKVQRLEALLAQKSANGKLAFVGDGINDAPVLARADIGIAMGALGSDAAIEAADVVIMTDEPSKLATAMRISQKTLRIVRQNIIFALGVKFLVLGLGAFGLANMWQAVFADVGVAVIAILNAMRMLRVK